MTFEAQPFEAPAGDHADHDSPYEGLFGGDSDHWAFGTDFDDPLAGIRDDGAYRNAWLAEAPNGDFGQTVARILLFATARLALLERLRASRDAVLAAVAGRGVPELAYHRDFAARWFVTLAR